MPAVRNSTYKHIYGGLVHGPRLGVDYLHVSGRGPWYLIAPIRERKETMQ